MENGKIEGGSIPSVTSMRSRRLFFCIFIAALAIILVACEPPQPVPRCPEEMSPDPVFRELYLELGGEETLGCIISPSFTYKDPGTNREMLCQYTEGVLMVHDPHGPNALKRRLAPIGAQMGVTQPPVPRPEAADVRWVEGHIVYDKFIPLYEMLGGMRYVGMPLTEVRYNPDRGRYEQYFENVGFYIKEGDEEKKVRVLPYGVWMCDANCKENVPSNAGPESLGPFYPVAPEFIDVINRVGADFVDFAISEVRTTPDGYLEQVFDNIVLVADPTQPGVVFAREITPIIGILPDPTMPRSEDPETYFVPVQGEMGYNIPKQFMDYLAMHGGLEFSGQPISERKLYKNDVYRQCFQNLCLLEDTSVPDYLRVQPDQLGFIYKKYPVTEVYGQQSIAQSAPAVVEPVITAQPVEQAAAQPVSAPGADGQGGSQVSLYIWDSDIVASNQIQEIGVQVTENGAPMVNVEAEVNLNLPNGESRKYYMPPTGADGQSRVQLQPIAAPNSTLIPYEVCVLLLGGQKLCSSGQYSIWDPPAPTP